MVAGGLQAALIASDLRSVGQIGTPINLGLLFDTFVVRALITPSIAALLGQWFWWPLRVASRPPKQRIAARPPTNGLQANAVADSAILRG